jgi:hypothetical protein
MKRFPSLAWTLPLSLLAFAGILHCGKKPPKTADSQTASADAGESSGDNTADKDKDKDKADGGKDECAGFEFADLTEALQKSACEAPNAKPDDKPLDTKGKLDIAVQASSLKVSAGQHVDLLVTFTNKSKADIPLYFTVDPLPRFDVETYDAKNNRVDMPKKPPPPLEPGVAPRVPGEAKIAKVTLASNGTAKLRLGWDAVKMKWAPEKVKGTPPEKGYPRKADGPLPKGKYTLRVVMPLVGVVEGVEKEISAPKVPIEVTK